MTIILSILLSAVDAYLYGYWYEKRLKAVDERYPHFFMSWGGFIWGKILLFLFKEITFKGRVYVPFYRLLIQWPLDIAVCYWVYSVDGLPALICMLGAWFFMFKEMNYYIFLWQFSELERFEREQIHVYWLDRPYFSGSFVFIGGFTVRAFWLSYGISWLLLILSQFIQPLLNEGKIILNL